MTDPVEPDPAGGDPEKPDPFEDVRKRISEADFAGPPDAPDDDDDGGSGDRHAPEPFAVAALPNDCPVTPLGQLGDSYFYLDQPRQLRELKAREHTRLNILSLMGTKNEDVFSLWPRYNANQILTGWRTDAAEQQLMAACSRRGVWDPATKLRGPGAWLGDDGGLVLHCGDAVLVNGNWEDPGYFGQNVYPTAAPQPRPGDISAQEARDQVKELLGLLESWTWRRGDNDAYLMLGWISAAMIGGALNWRPMAFVTGSSGSGKSTLQTLLARIFGGAMISVSDTSAAGVWQRIGHASVPVAIDEMEAEEDNRRSTGIIKLARQAASGGVILRGGSDHTGAEFKARSCFLFSAINIPPMMQQDRARIAFLELDETAEARTPPNLAPARLAKMGAAIQRLWIDQWPRWPATYETYRAALDAGGLGSRHAAEQFGALLAAADMLVNVGEPDVGTRELVDGWIEKIEAGAGGGVIRSTDFQDCLNHLLTSPLEIFRGGTRHNVGRWVQIAAGKEDRIGEVIYQPFEANNALETVGIKILTDTKDLPGQWLAVAIQHVGLTGLFRGTHWAAKSGANTVWTQTLRRVAGAQAWRPQRFSGAQIRCTVVPLDAALAGDGE